MLGVKQAFEVADLDRTSRHQFCCGEHVPRVNSVLSFQHLHRRNCCGLESGSAVVDITVFDGAHGTAKMTVPCVPEFSAMKRY